MATRIWRGDAVAVAQKNTATPANVELNDVFTLTMANKTVNYTSTGTAVTDVTAGLTTAWNNSTVLEHTEVTASDQTTHLQLLCDTAGLPYTVTSSAVNNSSGGTDNQSLTMATTTANSGPNDWSTAKNWYTSTGGIDDSGIPVDDDTVVVENSAVSILYGLDQTAATPAKIDFPASYTGNIGLPRTNAAGYIEYRETSLKITSSTASTTTLINIGKGDGNGSGRLKINTNTGVCQVTVDKTGTRAETGIPSLLLTGTSPGNKVVVNRGDAGLGFFGGESFIYNHISVGAIENISSDAKVVVGTASAQTTGSTHNIILSGGQLATSSNVVRVDQTGGKLEILGTATANSINIDGGTIYPRTSGTITSLRIGDGAVVDWRRDNRSRTVTGGVIYSGGTSLDPSNTVTWGGGGLDLTRCGLEDVTIQTGKNITLGTVSEGPLP